MLLLLNYTLYSRIRLGNSLIKSMRAQLGEYRLTELASLSRFAYCSSTLFRGGRGEKHKTVQIAVFPIILSLIV